MVKAIGSTKAVAASPSSPPATSASKPTLKKLKSEAVKIRKPTVLVTKIQRTQSTVKDDESSGIKSSKYPNVHHMKSGRWQAWTNCMTSPGSSRGPYVGVHDTENLAARAQDRSLLKHRALATKPIKLNFPETDYASDEKLRNALTNEEFLKLLALEARACYRKVQPTKCLEMFLAEEKALGTLPIDYSKGSSKRTYEVTSLRDYLKQILMNRPEVYQETNFIPPAKDVVSNPGSGVNNDPLAPELAWVGKRARSVRKFSV